MIQEALETGWIEGDGPLYPQPRTQIRPAPVRSFRDRTYAVATSEDSLEAAARLRAAMVMFADRRWSSRLPQIETWRTRYRDLHGEEPPPPLICDFVYCHEDADVAAEVGPRHLATYLESVLEHYEVMGDHFEGMKGYEAYAGAAGVLRRMGSTGFLDGFLTPPATARPARSSTSTAPAGSCSAPSRPRRRSASAASIPPPSRPACASSRRRSCPSSSRGDQAPSVCCSGQVGGRTSGHEPDRDTKHSGQVAAARASKEPSMQAA